MLWREKHLLEILEAGKLSTTEVVERASMSKATALKYLEGLKGSGLVNCEKIGPTKLWSLAKEEEVGVETEEKIGLDEILGGGFVCPSIILIAGGIGTGKTTLVLQSLFNAARNKERCLFIASVSEPVTSINDYLASFSFFDQDLETMHFVDAGELLIEKKMSLVS